MRYIVPKQLHEEMKLFDKPRIYMKDLFAVCVVFGLFLLLKGFVHSWLLIPYGVLAVICAWFLIHPASGNPQKRNWEAIVLLIGADRTTYFSENHVQEEPHHD